MKPPRVCKHRHHCTYKQMGLWPHMLGLLGFISGMLISAGIFMRHIRP